MEEVHPERKLPKKTINGAPKPTNTSAISQLMKNFEKSMKKIVA